MSGDDDEGQPQPEPPAGTRQPLENLIRLWYPEKSEEWVAALAAQARAASAAAEET